MVEIRGPDRCEADFEDDIRLTLEGDEFTAEKKGGRILVNKEKAPFHVLTTVSDSPCSLPAFDTCGDTYAAKGLANLLDEDVECVCLSAMDDASKMWSPELTEKLKKLGARHVPPEYRNSWAFVWCKEANMCFEAVSRPHSGAAEVAGELIDEGRRKRFRLISGGWFDGYSASIQIDGKDVLCQAPARGINIYVRKSGKFYFHRKFISHQPFQSFINAFGRTREPGSETLAFAVGRGKIAQYSRLARQFYEKCSSIGGTGRVLSPDECFTLCGKLQSSGSMKPREEPKREIVKEILSYAPSGKGYAYCSLLFGPRKAFLCGALVLGESLQEHCPQLPRILLVSPDVRQPYRDLLTDIGGWEVKDAPYLYGAHTLFHDDAKFPSEIFMKLHIFNPEMFPYEKVLFLDLDTQVRADLTRLFGLPAPAAVNNWKDDGNEYLTPKVIEEGTLMGTESSSVINAGVLLTSPNKPLFDMLVEDTELPGRHHYRAWAPEQTYMGKIFEGLWYNLTNDYNFEPQIHGGTSVSRRWAESQVEDVKVVHFSGDKPWVMNPHDEIICCRDRSSRTPYRILPEHLRELANKRNKEFRSLWMEVFDRVLLKAYKQIGCVEKPAPIDGITPEDRMVNFLYLYDPPPEVPTTNPGGSQKAADPLEADSTTSGAETSNSVS